MKKLFFIQLLLLFFSLHQVFSQAAEPEKLPFIDEITAFEQADKTSFPPRKAILFTGSSSIRFWSSLQESFPGKKVINRGFGGSGLSHLIQYADRIIFPYKPKQIVIYSGENDIADGKTAQQALAEFKTLTEKIKKQLPTTRIAYISMKPSPSRIDKIGEVKKANALIEAYLKESKTGKYINVFDPMLDNNGQPRSELFLEDRLHMNQKGYQLWTEIIRPYLK